MKNSQEKNLINNNNEPTELKELVNIDEDDTSKNDKEENPEEIKNNFLNDKNLEKLEENNKKYKSDEEEENKLNDDKNQDEKSETSSNLSASVGKKEIDSILLVLNSYWIELLGSISLIITILIYEFLILLGELLLYKPPQGSNNITLDFALDFIINDLGFKWFYFIRIGSHLSVGFFCLTTFTSIMKDTKNIKKFYIVSLIQVVIYYGVTLVVLKALLDHLFKNFLRDSINKAIGDHYKNPKVYEFFNKLIDKLIYLIGRFLSIFNTFLEKIVFGSLYIFLFYKPKCLEGKKLLYFRLLALIPIIYAILSLILRALHNVKKIVINVYVLPLLLSSKITIYMFFISTLSIIKYLSLKYEIFDEENDIQPRVFTKIGSKIFGALGVLELIIGLFLPDWSDYGIGSNYLLVLCAPIMVLYDYKRKYELKFPGCKKGNMTLCFKLVLLIVGWLFIVVLGLIILLFFLVLFVRGIVGICKFIVENFVLAVEIMNIFL